MGEDTLILGLATIVWTIAMVANRRVFRSRILRNVLYAAGLVILAYAVVKLSGTA